MASKPICSWRPAKAIQFPSRKKAAGRSLMAPASAKPCALYEGARPLVPAGWRLRMAVQHVRGDVRPEFAEGVGECVSHDGVSILDRDLVDASALAWVVRQRDALRDSPAQQLRNIEAVMPLIVGRDDNAGNGIAQALPF